MTQKIEAILFDLDGVITDTAEFLYQAWQVLADTLGQPFDREANEKLRGVSRRESLELILAGRTATEAEMQEWMDRKNRHYQELLQTLSPADLLPGVRDLLAEIRAAGLQMAVVSASHWPTKCSSRSNPAGKLSDALMPVLPSRQQLPGKPGQSRSILCSGAGRGLPLPGNGYVREPRC